MPLDLEKAHAELVKTLNNETKESVTKFFGWDKEPQEWFTTESGLRLTFIGASELAAIPLRNRGKFSCISIASVGHGANTRPSLEGFAEHLALTFDDMTHAIEQILQVRGETTPRQLFTAEHAQQIWQFLQSSEQVQTGHLIIQCEMGVSRSSAVAAALMHIYNHGNDTAIWQHWRAVPNLFVYGMMLAHAPFRRVWSAKPNVIVVSPSIHYESQSNSAK